VPRAAKEKPPPDPTRLKRSSAGEYTSGDGRFTLRQDKGGKWYATDTQQTNELGLELVLGPFDTIAEARESLDTQRDHPAGAEPGAKVRPIITKGRPRSTAAPTRPTRARAAPAPAAKSKPEPEPEPEPETPPVDYKPAVRKPTGDERDAVAGALRVINEAWVTGRPEEMAPFLDEDVVFVQPKLAGRESGRDKAIESYREFLTQAELHAYEETDLVIDVRGHAAVVTYRWAIDYHLAKKHYHETGSDLFVFDRAGTRWRAVWRLLLPD
jgi:hypothetical protein